MSAPYSVAAAARADLVDIYEYTVERWGYQQADSYQASLTKHFARISDHPFAGVSRDDLRRGVRTHPAESHVVYYRVRHGEVQVLRVLHSRQDARRAFRR